MTPTHEPPITVRVDPDIADLIPGYLENRRKDLSEIETALERKDYETIRILGHGMKGSGGGYGFDAITEMGRAIEQAAKQADGGKIKAAAAALAAYLDRVSIVSG